MSALTDILPASARKRLYALLGLVGITLGAIQTAYQGIGHQPSWVNVATLVLAYVAGALGFTAGANVPATAAVSPAAPVSVDAPAPTVLLLPPSPTTPPATVLGTPAAPTA